MLHFKEGQVAEKQAGANPESNGFADLEIMIIEQITGYAAFTMPCLSVFEFEFYHFLVFLTST
jgi:hypothetical protein